VNRKVSPSPIRFSTGSVHPRGPVSRARPLACRDNSVLPGLVQRRELPDLHRPVTAAADAPLPVRAVCRATDLLGVSCECEQLLSGFGIPDRHRLSCVPAVSSRTLPESWPPRCALNSDRRSMLSVTRSKHHRLPEAGLDPSGENIRSGDIAVSGGNHRGNINPDSDQFDAFCDLLRREYGFSDHEPASIPEAAKRVAVG
jgi:hypothetical protein